MPEPGEGQSNAAASAGIGDPGEPVRALIRRGLASSWRSAGSSSRGIWPGSSARGPCPGLACSWRRARCLSTLGARRPIRAGSPGRIPGAGGRALRSGAPERARRAVRAARPGGGTARCGYEARIADASGRLDRIRADLSLAGRTPLMDSARAGSGSAEGPDLAITTVRSIRSRRLSSPHGCGRASSPPQRCSGIGTTWACCRRRRLSQGTVAGDRLDHADTEPAARDQTTDRAAGSGRAGHYSRFVLVGRRRACGGAAWQSSGRSDPSPAASTAPVRTRPTALRQPRRGSRSNGAPLTPPLLAPKAIVRAQRPRIRAEVSRSRGRPRRVVPFADRLGHAGTLPAPEAARAIVAESGAPSAATTRQPRPRPRRCPTRPRCRRRCPCRHDRIPRSRTPRRLRSPSRSRLTPRPNRPSRPGPAEIVAGPATADTKPSPISPRRSGRRQSGLSPSYSSRASSSSGRRRCERRDPPPPTSRSRTGWRPGRSSATTRTMRHGPAAAGRSAGPGASGRPAGPPAERPRRCACRSRPSTARTRLPRPASVARLAAARTTAKAKRTRPRRSRDRRLR